MAKGFGAAAAGELTFAGEPKASTSAAGEPPSRSSTGRQREPRLSRAEAALAGRNLTILIYQIDKILSLQLRGYVINCVLITAAATSSECSNLWRNWGRCFKFVCVNSASTNSAACASPGGAMPCPGDAGRRLSLAGCRPPGLWDSLREAESLGKPLYEHITQGLSSLLLQLGSLSRRENVAQCRSDVLTQQCSSRAPYSQLPGSAGASAEMHWARLISLGLLPCPLTAAWLLHTVGAKGQWQCALCQPACCLSPRRPRGRAAGWLRPATAGLRDVLGALAASAAAAFPG